MHQRRHAHGVTPIQVVGVKPLLRYPGTKLGYTIALRCNFDDSMIRAVPGGKTALKTVHLAESKITEHLGDIAAANAVIAINQDGTMMLTGFSQLAN